MLDLQQNIVFTKEGPVHFVSSVSSAHSTPVCFVTLIETVTVPPNCQMCLPVKKTRHNILCTSGKCGVCFNYSIS